MKNCYARWVLFLSLLVGILLKIFPPHLMRDNGSTWHNLEYSCTFSDGPFVFRVNAIKIQLLTSYDKYEWSIQMHFSFYICTIIYCQSSPYFFIQCTQFINIIWTQCNNQKISEFLLLWTLLVCSSKYIFSFQFIIPTTTVPTKKMFLGSRDQKLYIFI